MLRILLSILILHGVAGRLVSQTADFYVAPIGNDSAAGTLSAPFATLDHARIAVRSLKQNSPGRSTAITVLIRGGTYYLAAPLNFSSADSGSSAAPIVYAAYPGETPVISGGSVITGWQQTQPGVWTAALPASIASFEQLFVNGQRRYRPRTTKSGYLHIVSPVYVSSPASNCSVLIQGQGYECFDRFHYSPGDLQGSYYDINSVEVDDFEQWTMSKMRLASVDSVNHIAIVTGPTAPDSQNHQGFIAGHRYLLENVKEALSQPGEWYLDRLAFPQTLTYLAKPGEDLTALPVVAPQLPQVLVAIGLQYVTFQGITFSHDNWVAPAAGHASTQGEPLVSAALSFTGSSNVTVDSCIVAHTGGWGLEFVGSAQSPGTQGNRIVNNMFYDIGTGGIRIGMTPQAGDSDGNVAQNNLVQNNVLAGGGRVLADGVAIWQGNAHNNTYTHNDIFDWYHSGVEVCLAGTTACALPHDIEVSFNHVWQIGQGVTSGMGGVYFSSYSATGNRVLNNKIHDVTHNYQDSDGYGGTGIYFDSQTSGVTAQNNLAYRISQAAYFNDQGVNNVFTNNIVAYPRLGAVQRGHTSQDARAFTFTNNIVWFTTAVQTPGNWSCTNLAGQPVACSTAFTFDANLYWNPSGAPPSFITNQPDSPDQYTNYTFTQWQQTLGEDIHSINSNPLFVNPTYPADDFRLQAASPAVQQRILTPFDSTQAGRTAPLLNPPALDPAWPLQSLDPMSDYGQTASLTGLNVSKSHSGNFTPGQQNATYSVVVSNQPGDPGTTGAVTVTESIPLGLTLVSMAGAGWTCPFNGNTCSRSDVLAGGASYPAIQVSVNVSPNAPSQVTNRVTVSGGGFGTVSASDVTNVVSSSSPPAPLGASPAAGSGTAAITFTFSDARGWQDLGVVNILINNFLDGRHACYLAYSRPLNVLYLVGDDGGTLLAGSTLTASGSANNGQCTVSWGNSPVNGSGNVLGLTLNIAFNASFAGNKVIYLAAGDMAGNNSGWQPLGVWQVPGAPPSTTTAVTGMNPTRGSGLNSTTFTFAFSDTNGVQDLGVENILVNNFLDGRHACYLAYARPINVLYLINDNGDALLPGQSLGASGSLANSQCTVNWGSGAVVAGGNNLTLTLNLSFLPGFGGNRVFYVATRDGNEGNNTGWGSMGTWSVQ